MLAVKKWKLDGYSFEDFQIEIGQKVVLQIPGPIDWRFYNRICELLVGAKKSSSIQLECQLMFVPLEYRKWKLFNRSAKSYLSDLSISETDIVRILGEYGIQEKMGFNRLGYSERCLLAIEVAICKKLGLIYSSAGLDGNGLHKVQEKVSQLLEHSIVIQIDFPNNRDEKFNEQSSATKLVSVIPPD